MNYGLWLYESTITILRISFNITVECVFHGAARNSMKQLTYDVENLVLKVYAKFSNSAKRVKELQIFFEEFKI